MRFFSNIFAITSLILANLIPLYGVLYLQWNVFSLLLIYWLENVVIGYFNVLKMKKAQGTHGSPMQLSLNGKPVAAAAQKPFLISFFMLHYGIFTLVHGVFVIIFFFMNTLAIGGVLATIPSLIISHYISYQTNFIGHREYLHLSPDSLFFSPYKRVIVMHLTIILGSFFALQSADPTPILVIMIVMKIVTDLASHLFEHRAVKLQTKINQ